MAQKPWEHAKSEGSEGDELAARFVESLSYDTRLYKHDIAGSIAHARMLQHVGLIDEKDLVEIERGLNEIESEIEAAGVTGWPGWKVELEDVHMCIEAALIEKVGEPGKKLHTGRSRNDQVALDLRLWTNDAARGLAAGCRQLCAAFVERAVRDGEIVMPSYTHLQRAQPIVVGGELIAWLSAFDQCRARFTTRVAAWCNHNPLGSGAIAGSSLPLDRVATGRALFPDRDGNWTPTGSSIHATASRDVAVDFVYECAMTAQWLSRWAEQWIIYMTAEFGFLTIGDAYTTGSSMMPQKRNPDMLELIRGRCGNVYGHLVALLTMCKGLTVGYNRDLQEDKRHVFAAYDTVTDCLAMATRIVRSARFNQDRIKATLDRGFLDATSLAEYLVTKGVPFRTAHQVVGAAVRHCIDRDIVKLADLSVVELNGIAAPHGHARVIGEDVHEWLGAENVVKRYQTYGNAGLSGFRQQLAEWKQRLGEGDAPDRNATPPGPGALFDVGDAGEAELIAAYERQGRTLDDLPYTEQFEAIAAAAGTDDRAALFHRLHNIRKAGRLPKVGKAWEAPPRVTDAQQQRLSDLVIESVGKLSLRDQLPFTPQFDGIVQRFNTDCGLNFSPYQVWRVIAKLAK